MLQQRGARTLAEIKEQPKLWQEILNSTKEKKDEVLDFIGRDVRRLLFVGCGSSYHLCSYLAGALNNKPGKIKASALPSSDILYADNLSFDTENTIVVAVSRSGETSETILAMNKLKEKYGMKVAGITGADGSSLQKNAGYSLVYPGAGEEGVIMLKSFTGFLVAGSLICSWLCGDSGWEENLFKLFGELDLDEFHDRLRMITVSRPEQIVCLGAGPYYSLAKDAALKLIEMAGAPADSYQTLEFRHGPISSVTSRVLTVIFSAPGFQQYEEQVVREIVGYKGRCMVLTESASNWYKNNLEYVFELKSGLAEPVCGILIQPHFQLFSFYLSIARGANPDKPRRIAPVVKLGQPGE
ncbi:MAG: SIS domain-containing protein [Chloroflexi bacterium]|nr:SIS domain-containing protein [Chloroflexota bacterium]